MHWPQIGKDLVALRVASSERALLAVMCHNEGETELWGVNTRAGMTPTAQDDDSWDEDIQSSLQLQGGDWVEALFSVATITEGKSVGCRAVGVGSNVEKRSKAVRLAMAVTLQIFEGAGVVQELQHVVVQAKFALTLAGSNQFRVDRSTEATYCTYCNCWSDLAHQHGKQYRNALVNYDASHTTPSYEPVDKHDASAEPPQIEEIIPPMDTEVIVEGNLSSLASCPGALSSAWLWLAGMQGSRSLASCPGLYHKLSEDIVAAMQELD